MKPDTKTEIRWLRDALERTDIALRAVLDGKSVRDAEAILTSNAWLLFGDPTEKAVVVSPEGPPYCGVEWYEERGNIQGPDHSCVLRKGHEGVHRCGSRCGSTHEGGERSSESVGAEREMTGGGCT